MLKTHLSENLIYTGVPQGCVTIPFPESLFTNDYRPVSSNAIIKFADDTTVIGPIKDSDEARLQRGGGSYEWCDTDNLLLNNEMTKEFIVDFMRIADTHTPIHIKGMAVEDVKSFNSQKREEMKGRPSTMR